MPFVWQVRVYWEDTDGGGVVYHSNYLKYFERARTEWLRARGVHQSILAVEENLVFAIQRMAIDWVAPARLDDLLDITVHDVNAGAARLRFTQEMRRVSDGVEIARADVVAVSLDAQRFKPKKMPEWIRSEINQ